MTLKPKAIHLPGGNQLDEIKIDLEASIRLQDVWLNSTPKETVKRSALANLKERLRFSFLKHIGLWDPMIMFGIEKSWFLEFSEFWGNCLCGRPIHIMDFHGLSMSYRKKFHQLNQLSWNNTRQHIANYQLPENLFCLMSLVLRDALNPIRAPVITNLLQPGITVLEFGCFHAPIYRSWRLYYSHKPCNWVLADIPNFGFLYSRYLYGKDGSVEFVLIEEDCFNDPLGTSTEKTFDMIIVQEVFEHLQNPRQTAEYLVEHLKSDGILVFDYIESNATGLDTPAGLKERENTLKYLFETLKCNSDNGLIVCKKADK